MNSPSQVELMQILDDSGFYYDSDSNGRQMIVLGVDENFESSIAKFAQLLLQREGGEAADMVPDGWKGWACQYPNSLPRLYGDKSIAMLNYHPEEGDRLLYLTENQESQQPAAASGEVDNQCSYRLEASLDYLERILSKIGVIDPGATNGDGPLLFLAAEIYLGEPQ